MTEYNFEANLIENQDFDCTFDGDEEFAVDLGGATIDQYQGSYEVTPTEETQVLATTNKAMAQNVTIAPIPSNYGLITWDGNTLTVS